MGVAQQKIADIQPFAELARSATTVVYKGYQRSLGRFVLLKVLQPGLSHDDERVRRFEAEARLIAQVQHPNVVAIYAAGRDDGQAYIAAEFVEGIDGRALMERGPLPPDLAAFVVLEAARGLEAAHIHGILHRDLKPSNILISHDGQVKLTDFGMASLVDEEAGAEVRGTPGYLAPELVRGEPPGEASDLFSLGATFYEALAGRPAFTGAGTAALLDAVLNDDPMPRLERFVDLPEALCPICARLLAKNPDERYPDAPTLIADLEAFRVARGGTMGTAALKTYLDDPEAYRGTVEASFPLLPEAGPVLESEDRAALPARPVSLRRWAWGAVLAILIAGGLGSGLFLKNGKPASSPVVFTDEATSRLPEIEASPSAGSEEEAGDGRAAMQVGEPDPPEAVVPPPDSSETTALVLDDTTAQEMTPPAVADESVEATGTLQIVVEPWADVYLGDELKGRTPLDPLTLDAGTYRIGLNNPDFPEEYSVDVTVRPGEADSLRVALWEYVGRLRLEISPWAEIAIDGDVGETVAQGKPLLIVKPGRRKLSLRHSLGVFDTTLTVAPNEVVDLQFNLITLLRK